MLTSLLQSRRSLCTHTPLSSPENVVSSCSCSAETRTRGCSAAIVPRRFSGEREEALLGQRKMAEFGEKTHKLYGTHRNFRSHLHVGRNVSCFRTRRLGTPTNLPKTVNKLRGEIRWYLIIQRTSNSSGATRQDEQVSACFVQLPRRSGT